jgi:hypothetical protein
LVDVDVGVAWVNLCCPQVVQVVEHRIVIDVTVGVITFEPTDQVSVDKVETQEDAAVLSHSVDQEWGLQLVSAAPAAGTVFLREGPGSAK